MDGWMDGSLLLACRDLDESIPVMMPMTTVTWALLQLKVSVSSLWCRFTGETGRSGKDQPLQCSRQSITPSLELFRSLGCRIWGKNFTLAESRWNQLPLTHWVSLCHAWVLSNLHSLIALSRINKLLAQQPHPGSPQWEDYSPLYLHSQTLCLKS